MKVSQSGTFQELWKSLQVQFQKPSSATMKLCSHEDRHRKGRLSFIFNRTMTQHTSRLCKGYLTMKESDGVLHQMTWELFQDCWNSIPGEAGWENAKSVQSCHQGKGWLLWRISNIKNICLTLFWWLIPYMLFHSFDVFTIILQCRK